MNTLKKKMNKKGFTLAELLIVVAIIAVLVAISIPIFTSQLEKSREATDAANIRNAIAQVSVDYLTDQDAGTKSYEVKLAQKTEGWQTSPAPTFKNSKGEDITSSGIPKVGKKATIAITAEGVVSVTFEN